jgi:hypothetical protein
VTSENYSIGENTPISSFKSPPKVKKIEFGFYPEPSHEIGKLIAGL